MGLVQRVGDSGEHWSDSVKEDYRIHTLQSWCLFQRKTHLAYGGPFGKRADVLRGIAVLRLLLASLCGNVGVWFVRGM